MIRADNRSKVSRVVSFVRCVRVLGVKSCESMGLIVVGPVRAVGASGVVRVVRVVESSKVRSVPPRHTTPHRPTASKDTASQRHVRVDPADAGCGSESDTLARALGASRKATPSTPRPSSPPWRPSSRPGACAQATGLGACVRVRRREIGLGAPQGERPTPRGRGTAGAGGRRAAGPGSLARAPSSSRCGTPGLRKTQACPGVSEGLREGPAGDLGQPAA